jgi:adenosylcobinamide-GDP ribazoletransferase
MVILKRILFTVQFLTAVPLRIKLDVDGKDLGKGLAFAPLIGLFVGGILALLYKGLSYLFPISITAVFLIVSYIILTGGLHFDGLGDTFDGVFSNRPRQKVLEIMHDSRIGTNAALVMISIILIDVAFFMNINSGMMLKTLILMPVAGRIGCLIGAGFSRYARSDESLGKPFVDYCTKKEVLIGVVIYFAAFFMTGGREYALLSSVPVISSLLLTKYFSSKIGGITGDILGAICEINQALFLVLIYLAGKFIL